MGEVGTEQVEKGMEKMFTISLLQLNFFEPCIHITQNTKFKSYEQQEKKNREQENI